MHSRCASGWSVAFGTIDTLQRAGEDPSGIRWQPLDCVALIEDDVVDFQLACRLSAQRLLVGNVSGTVCVIVSLAMQLLRHNLPAEIDRRSAVPKTRSASSACAEATKGRASGRKLSLASEAPNCRVSSAGCTVEWRSPTLSSNSAPRPQLGSSSCRSPWSESKVH